MIPFFTPKYLKEGRGLLKHAQKLLNYKRDLLTGAEVEGIESTIAGLKLSIAARDRAAIESAAKSLETRFAAHHPPAKHAGWRENTEVFVVAIVIALGVRTYYLQPFTIPTGSMHPTLNGIMAFETAEPPPNFLVQVAHTALFGRTYINTVAKANEQIVDVTERQYLRFFTVSKVTTSRGSYWVRCPRETLAQHFRAFPGNSYKAGQTIARGCINTGDHVFVDKMSYHFRPPSRADVFVFKTTGIHGIESRLDPAMGSQFYIKRLCGLPGDELRIEPPTLFINGKPAEEPQIRRVASAKDGYRGYGLGPVGGYLSAPETPFRVPAKTYFALGDNSYNSADSRFWGIVPQENIIGRGLFVYWPFSSHWGLIK